MTPSKRFVTPVRSRRTNITFQKLVNYPFSTEVAATVYNKKLTCFEHIEILGYKDIYFLGQSSNKITDSLNYDDEEGNYCIVIGDHIQYRYEITEVLGRG